MRTSILYCKKKSHIIGICFNSFLSFCQAQPQFQLSWAELALVLIPPAARPSAPLASRPAVRNSSEIAGIEQNLLFKSCMPTLLDLKTSKEILKR